MTVIGPPISFRSTGWGVEPCPGCQEIPQPNQDLVTRPGEWRAWHALCFDVKDELVCDWCEERHAPPHDGSCLL
jgi:hypothetical protein